MPELIGEKIPPLLRSLPPKKRLELGREIIRQSAKHKNGETDFSWQPVLGPQQQAFESQADELFYGGQAGGGKSDLLLGVAGSSHWRSIIFRRVFPNLRDIIERSRDIFNARGLGHAKDSFNESTHIWRLLNGKIVELASIQHEKDKENFRGRPHDFYGWDEITEFTETQYRFVNAWNRSTRPGQRCRIIAAGNPPTTAEGEWVIRYWAPWLDDGYEQPALPGDLRWFARIDDKDVEVENGKPFEYKGNTITPRSRTFIPAGLRDNPYLRETGYESVLQALPEPLRSALLLGSFKINREEDPWQVIPRAWVRAAQERWKASSRPEIPMTQLGVDCARGGKDKTVLSPLYATWFDEQKIYPGSQTPDGQSVATLIVATSAGHQPRVNIDVIGIGASCYDHAKHAVDAVPVNVAEKSEWRDKSGKLKMANQRAEMYWSFREALDPISGKNLALPPSKTLENDLCAARWELRSTGITIESKEEITARLGRSPDEGEAAMLAYFRSHMAPPSAVVMQPKKSQFIRRGVGL